MTAFPSTHIAHLLPIFEGLRNSNPFDGEARAASIDPTRSVVLRAPAGSGKTTQLLFRHLSCLTIASKPEEVLAITFTNKAAAEIVERVLDALKLAATGVEPTEVHEIPLFQVASLVLQRDAQLGWNLLQNPSRLRIMTFDSFCAFLAAKLPIMSGLGGGHTTDDPGLIYRAAILDTLAAVNGDDTPDDLRTALEAVLGFAKNRFESLVPMFDSLLGKRDQWAGEVMHLDVSEMEQALEECVSGQLEASVSLLKKNGLQPVIDALIQGSSLGEQVAWAADLSSLSGDISSLQLLRKTAEFLLTKDGTLRSKVDTRVGFPAGTGPTKAMNAALADLKDTDAGAAISGALKTLKSLPDLEYPAGSAAMCAHFTVILRYLLANLAIQFDAQAAVDFQEVAQRAIQALGAGEEIGDALLDEDRVNHILVDEVQDTSKAQFKLLMCLTAHWEEGDGRSIFFCGDLFQSIYYFRGASTETYTEIANNGYFGQKQLDVYYLTVNFRSVPGVVEWNNEAYSEIFKGQQQAFVPSNPFRGGHGGVEIHPVSSGPIGEAQEVLKCVQAAQAEDPNQSIAILVRGRGALAEIVPVLKEAGISISGKDIDAIGSASPVSELICLIRALWHEADRTSWFGLLRSAMVGLSWDDCVVVAQHGRVVPTAIRSQACIDHLSDSGKVRIERLNEALEAISKSSNGDDLAWASKAVWVSLGGPATVTAGELTDIETVFGILIEHTKTGCLVSPQAFFRALSSLYAAPRAGSVQVMTIHASKGLEFDTVIIPGVSRTGATDDTPLFYWRRIGDVFTIAPNVSDAGPEASESRLFNYLGGMVKADIAAELSRLAYVGTTRGKRNVHIFCEVERYDEEGTVTAKKNSLLGVFWPVVGETVANVVPGVRLTRDVVSGVPSKARLEPNFRIQLPTEMFVPALSNDQLPTEADLAEEILDEEGGDFRARAVGLAFHRVIELVCKHGPDQWTPERIKMKSKAIASMLLRDGYPSTEIVVGVNRVIELIEATLSNEKGRWITKPRQSAGQEVQISMLNNGRWVNRYLDLNFIEDDTMWIIDWKTGAAPAGMSVEDFIKRESVRYAAKMEEYALAAKAAGIMLRIKKALFFPAHGVFVELP